MATKKTTTKSVKNMSNNNETKVMCPVCGAEFDILAQHEHTVKNAVAIGKDSGLGTIYLPVSKRAEALNAAGVSTKKYFAMNALDGSVTE
jgi:transcription elongation factor Elf1